MPNRRSARRQRPLASIAASLCALVAPFVVATSTATAASVEAAAAASAAAERPGALGMAAGSPFAEGASPTGTAAGSPLAAEAGHSGDSRRWRSRPALYELDGEGVFPEGVAVGGRHVYVTSKADGTVYRGTRSGSTLRPWLPGGVDGRTTATGVVATRDRVVVAGAETGRLDVYDARSARLLATYRVPDPEAATFVNDVVLAASGDLYATDSERPVIYRVLAAEIDGSGPLGSQPGLAVERTLEVAVGLPPDSYGEGFNANGIVATRDGSALLVVYSNSGALYRVDLGTGDTQQVDLDRPLLNGDGLQLRGRTLYVARNFDNLVVGVRLTADHRRGVTRVECSYPGADVPTTLAFDRGSLLAVNSQFDTFFLGEPLTSPRFTVSRLHLPLGFSPALLPDRGDACSAT